MLRYTLCRDGIEQMRADADEAVHRYAAAGLMVAAVPTAQGIARVLSGDLDGGDAFFEEALTMAHHAAPDVVVRALAQRALVAMERHQWSQAEEFASQARGVLHRAGLEKFSLLCAVQARLALHRGDIPAARRELASAQEFRPLLTYALPHLSIQFRIELIRVHLGRSDLAGARTLMREVDEMLERRPGMGVLVAEAEALRARLSAERGSADSGASALTTAELRLLPLLTTHMSFPEIAAELCLSPNTIKSQAVSIYRKLDASSRHQAVTRSRELGLLDG